MSQTKFVIWYDNRFGRNDGPPLYYFNVLREQLKLDTLHLIPEGDVRRFGGFDYQFWVDWGEDGLPVDLSWQMPVGGKKIYVVSDYHLDEKGYRINKAKQFDYVFVNQKWYVPLFEKAGIKNVQYLPHAAEPKAYPYFEILKKWDLCFIGHIQEYHKGNTVNLPRIEILEQMFKAIPNFYFGFRQSAFPEKNMFEDASKKFCQSKVVFNCSVGNDLNMRFFEVLSSGSFLLTNWIPELTSVPDLIDDKHYVTYRTMKEAIEKTRYYIEHDKEREEIAKAGHKQFLAGHTYKHRVKTILNTVGYKIK